MEIINYVIALVAIIGNIFAVDLGEERLDILIKIIVIAFILNFIVGIIIYC